MAKDRPKKESRWQKAKRILEDSGQPLCGKRKPDGTRCTKVKGHWGKC